MLTSTSTTFRSCGLLLLVALVAGTAIISGCSKSACSTWAQRAPAIEAGGTDLAVIPNQSPLDLSAPTEEPARTVQGHTQTPNAQTPID